MLPRWLLKKTSRLSAGEKLVFGCLLAFARGDDTGPSETIGMPADIARQVGLTPNFVRRALRKLESMGLVVRVGSDVFEFLAHPLMGEPLPPCYAGSLNVEGAWANDAFFIPEVIARQPRDLLTPGAKIYWALIHRYGKREWGFVAAKQSTLAAELKVSVRQIQKYDVQIESKGLVYVEDRRPYRRPNKMKTRVGLPLVGMTRAEARSELKSRRAKAARRQGSA